MELMLMIKCLKKKLLRLWEYKIFRSMIHLSMRKEKILKLRHNFGKPLVNIKKPKKNLQNGKQIKMKIHN